MIKPSIFSERTKNGRGQGKLEQKNYIIYVDTGGTFTDAVVVEPAGTFIVGKAPTTTDRLEIGFLNAIGNAAEKNGERCQ